MSDKTFLPAAPRTREEILNSPIEPSRFDALVNEAISRAKVSTERAPVQDTAVGIYDTVQSIGAIPLAILPGIGLEQGAKSSAYLDRFRSPGYLQERADKAQRVDEVTAQDGEIAGLTEAVKSTLSGDNLAPDVLAQSPYLLIGPVARALGFAAAGAVPGVVGRGLAAIGGTSEVAIVNRVAALSGVLEGAGGYGQTYQRAKAQGATDEEAESQARITGLASAVAGFTLGKLTPGFELDPTGLSTKSVASQFIGDAIKPALSRIGGEAVEEGGMAITNTVVDNILAGKDPMEGVGGAVGEAVAISSVFTGGMQSPGLIRNTSKAIGKGVVQGIKAAGSAAAGKLRARAVTPQAAAVDAALAAVNSNVETTVEPTAQTNTSAETISDADRAIKTIQEALRDITEPERATTETAQGEGTVQEEAPTPPIETEIAPVVDETPPTEGSVDPLTINDPDVKAVLAAEAISTVAEAPTEDGEVTREQAAAIEKLNALERSGDVDEARVAIENKSDAVIAQAAQDAPQNPEAAGLIAAVAATDITRVPDSVVPDALKPVVDKLKAVVAAVKAKVRTPRTAAAQNVSDQMLTTGWNTTGKRNARKKGMQEHVQNVINRLRVLREDQRNTSIDLGAATEASRFMKQIAARAAAFKKAGEILAIVNNWGENKTKYPEYKKYVDQGFIDVEGTETLDEDGKGSGKPFRVHLGNKTSEGMVDVVLEDFADAMSFYDALKSSYPKLIEAAEERADKQKEQKDARLARRELREDNKPKTKPAAEQKKTEPAKKVDKPETTTVTASDPVVARKITRALAAKGLKPVLKGSTVTVEAKDAAAAEAELAIQEKTAADQKKEIKTSTPKPKVATPPPSPAATATPAPTASESAAAPVVTPNTIVTDARAEELRNKFKGTKLNSGLDPELVAASLELAIYHIERGARTFAAYSKVMLAEVGEAIRPYLKSAYKAARFDNRLPQAVRNEMTSISEVNKASDQETQEDLTDDEAEAERSATDAAAAEDLLAFENAQDIPTGRPDPDANVNSDQVVTPTVPTENPLTAITNWAKVAGKTLLELFDIKKDVSYESWVQKLKAANVYQLYEAEAQNLFNHFYALGDEYTATPDKKNIPIGVFQAGEGNFVGREDKDKPFGSVSIFMTEDGRIPEVVGRAFALAGTIVLLRNSALYNTRFNEEGKPRRDALPGVWAKDIAELALKILGAKAIRKYSLSIEQGAPLSLGLSTVEALVRSGNFETEIPGVYTHAAVPMQLYQNADAGETTYESKILIPNDSSHTAGVTNLEGIDRTAEIFELERVWEVSDTAPEDMSLVDKVIQFTNTKLSTKLRQGLFNRERVAHGMNTQMNDVMTALGIDNMAAILMGWYADIPEANDATIPKSVRQSLRSMHTAYMNEFKAAAKYAQVTENGLKKLYYKYHLGINNRAKTVMGPQNNKFLRDMFSSAQETLDLSNPDHVKFLKLALAQALGVKTDINDHDTVISKWDTEVSTEYTELALKIQDALATTDTEGKEIDPFTRQGKILEALRRDKPWSPRQLSAMLTLGKMLKTMEAPAQADGTRPFENFLPFEIDGKTNGAFNTELFFGLGVRHGANLEQGGLFLSKIGATYEKERERMKAEYQSDDFYGRINQGAEIGYAQNLLGAFEAMQRKNSKLDANWWFSTVVQGNLNLLEAAGLIEFDADPKKTFSIILPETGKTGVVFYRKVVAIPQLRQFKFKRDAGKIAAIPVQYGGSPNGVKSQLWSEMVRLLNQKWVELNTQMQKTPPGEARNKLFNQIKTIEEHLLGSDSFGKMDKKGKFKSDPTNAEKLWHYATRDLAKALHGAYRSQKPRVSEMTDSLVALTNAAFMVKAAQWKIKLEQLKREKAENKALIEKYGEKTWLFEPSREDFEILNRETLDLSFSTLNGSRTVSLNSTEYDPDGSKVSGFGTAFETRLDIPTPKRVGVRILALLTIGGGDASMGTDFFQGDWNATDVFDGIELLVTDIMKAGEALNQSVWNTGEFDILKDFFRMNEAIVQFIQKATPEEQEALLEIWEKLRPKKNLLFDVDNPEDEKSAMLKTSFNDFKYEFESAQANFSQLYKEQRRGWEQLVADGPHTMYQMGGGGTFTTPEPAVQTEPPLREASDAGYKETDTALKTMFNVTRTNTLDRAGIIAALDKVQWKSRIHRAVWKRLRNLLNANIRVTLADTVETWDNWATALGVSAKFGSVAGLSYSEYQRIAVLRASPTLILHELLHSVFTDHIQNFFDNINAVPVELRGPINDLVQLMERFKKLPDVGGTGYVQRMMWAYEQLGKQSSALDEMLSYVLTSQKILDENAPGLAARILNRVKQIFATILKLNIETPFYDEALNVFDKLASTVVPSAGTSNIEPRAAHSLADLEDLTTQAYSALGTRIYQGLDTNMVVLKREWPRVLGMAKSAYNLSVEQEQMFTRIYVLMRAGQRSADVEEFINITLPKHPQKNLFLNAPDMVAAAMALVAVEPTFANQLNALWTGRPTKSRLNGLIDKALDTGQADTSQQILRESLSSILMNKEAYHSFLGTSVSRLNRLGKTVLEKIGATADDLSTQAPEYVDTVLMGIAALTSEKSAQKYGQILQTAVNTLTEQRWLQKLVADVQGTKGDGKLFHRAHNAMMNAINRTRSQFDNALPRELAKLFPENFDGWNTLFESFGTLGAHVLGSSAGEMYLNDAERKRMITVLESKVNNWIDAKNLGYYLVHRDIRPGSAQELLRNARAIADNINGDRQTASEELVAQVDQLVTLYAIDFLTASERAKVGKYFTAHPESMNNLIGMLKSVKEIEENTYSKQYQYLYWKDSLPMSTDPRSSVIIANAVDGARAEKLGFIKGALYKRSSGDPDTLHYYVRNWSPPPVFSQGIVATVEQTGEGINFTTAASISPLVGTMITDKRVISYIQRNRGMNSNLIPIHSWDGELIGYERILDPKIVRQHLKGNNTLLHVAIGKRMGRIAEENIAKMVNDEAIKSMVEQWENGKVANRADEYEAVDSSKDKQVARAWEVIPADMKKALQKAFNGPVMIRKDLVEDTIGYHNASGLEIFTGDASIDPQTRKAVIGLVQTVFMGPKGMQRFLMAEQAVIQAVATAKDTIIVRSLSVPYNNFIASVHLVLANGVPISKVFKWYRQGMKEIRDFNRLERERIQLTIQIAGTENDAEKTRLRAIQNSKIAAIQRLSIYPLIAAGDLSDLPEGLDETPSHTYLGDLAGWVNGHLKEKIHPKAPAYLANVLFAKDTVLHDAMSKAIQAGDFLARYAIYQHMIEKGYQQEDAIDEVRDELVSYQSNPGRMRAGLETYGMIWWSQFTIRAQNVILNRFRKNPFSFFVSQGLAGVLGTPGPMDGFITERGLDNSIGVDNVFTAPSAYVYFKAY